MGYHHIVEESEWALSGRDARWRHINRPFVVAGGKLSMADLDLIYDPGIKYYEAPLHNGQWGRERRGIGEALR